MSERPYVAVVGGINLDIQARCHRPFRAGDSNPGSLSFSPGGVGRNIAENLVRLGARVELVSVLGGDDHSARLEASCASIGIGLEGSLRLRGGPASHYLCILDSDGSLAGAVAAMDSIDSLSPDRLEAVSSVLDRADLVMIDANVPETSIAWLAARYPKGTAGPLLGFDPVSVAKAARGASSLGSFSFAKPNRAEAAVLAGLSAKDAAPDRNSPAALAGLLRARGLGEAFISLGVEGLFAEGPGGAAVARDKPAVPMGRERWLARLPSEGRRLAPVSSSGAGDAASAAIAWSLLMGSSLGDRCALALAAAMLAASSESPVNPLMNAALLVETAKGIERERLP